MEVENDVTCIIVITQKLVVGQPYLSSEDRPLMFGLLLYLPLLL